MSAACAILLLFYSVIVTVGQDVDKTNRFAVKLSQNFRENAKQNLEDNGFEIVKSITPRTLIVQYSGPEKGDNVLKTLEEQYPNQIEFWEPVRTYVNELKPAIFNDRVDSIGQVNLVCEKYYGLGIEDVWKRGYTGLGVTVAITDVGVNVDLIDLTKNMRKDLNYNFIKDNDDVTPENFPDYQAESSYHTDHGNNVASVVAAEKDNDVCSAGIAYNAQFTALKIYQVHRKENHFEVQHMTKSDITASALTHRITDIDIFVNAWSAVHDFDDLENLTQDALKRGATQGRTGSGTLYLVPAGPTGNGLTNNIYTITVGAVGRYGRKNENAYIDASILTCGLSDGNNLTAPSMITTTRGNRCVTTFKGYSAATAQVGGILALALDANMLLSQRSVQHLLIQASEHMCLEEKAMFQRNGAGRYFHPQFGYGLLNASKLVSLAINARKLGEPPKMVTKMLQRRPVKGNDTVTVFCYTCAVREASCLTTVEQVEVSVNVTTNQAELRITIESPSSTKSLLMQKIPAAQNTRISGKFVSTHFWDETAFGHWAVRIEEQNMIGVDGTVSVKLYGTHQPAQLHIQDKFPCSEDTPDKGIMPVNRNTEDESRIVNNIGFYSSYEFIAVCSMVAIFFITTCIIVIVTLFVVRRLLKWLISHQIWVIK